MGRQLKCGIYTSLLTNSCAKTVTRKHLRNGRKTLQVGSATVTTPDNVRTTRRKTEFNLGEKK